MEKIRADYERLIHTELRLIRQRLQTPGAAIARPAEPVPQVLPALDYARFADLCVGSNLAPLAGAFPGDAAVLLTAGQTVWRPRLKSRDDPFPPLPKQSAANAGRRRLLPGMIGTMRVSLQKFADAYLLPASAVYTKAGQS